MSEEQQPIEPQEESFKDEDFNDMFSSVKNIAQEVASATSAVNDRDDSEKKESSAAEPSFQAESEETSAVETEQAEEAEQSESVEQKEEQPVVEEAKPEPVQQTVRFDPEQMKLLLAQQQQAQQVPQQTAQQPAFTQEEFDAATRAFKISKQHLLSIGVADPSDELVLNFQKNLVEPIVSNAESRAVLMMQAMQKQQNEKLEQQVKVLSEYIQSKAKEDVKTQFYGKYPALKDYEEFVGFVASKNPRATLDQVASDTIELLNRAGNKISLNKPQATVQRKEATHSAVPQMNKMQGTGRSNGEQKTTKAKTAHDEIADLFAFN